MMELLGSVESLLSQIISPRNLKWFVGLTAMLISTAICYYPVSLMFATKHHTCGTVHSEFQNHHRKGKFKCSKYRSL